MTSTPRIVLLSALAVLIVLTGCRTYGGHDTEARTYAQMQQATDRFADDLRSAERDLEALQEAAATNEALERLAERFEGFVETHRERIDEHAAIVDMVDETTAYRTLHMRYHQIITEQRMVNQAYRRTTELVYAIVNETDVPTQVARESDAFTEPLIYRQQRNAPALTMRDVLNP